jgi:hypothetical protein
MNPNVALINGWLKGSPYMVDDSEEGEAWAVEILNRQVALQRRVKEATATFEQRSVDARSAVSRDLDLRLIFESNAIEDVDISLAETRQLLESDEANKLDIMGSSRWSHLTTASTSRPGLLPESCRSRDGQLRSELLEVFENGEVID